MHREQTSITHDMLFHASGRQVIVSIQLPFKLVHVSLVELGQSGRPVFAPFDVSVGAHSVWCFAVESCLLKPSPVCFWLSASPCRPFVDPRLGVCFWLSASPCHPFVDTRLGVCFCISPSPCRPFVDTRLGEITHDRFGWLECHLAGSRRCC
jgi:hypothetical protein